jgi:beta-glucosidase
MIQFPSTFLWGAATSAHQVEGNNANNDWWKWEQAGGGKEPSGQACRSYELYAQDFYLAQELHHNCHRLSVEWSRIEPAEREFSQKEIAHYKTVIRSLKERNLEPVVTLHHFTNPAWFAKKGAWVNRKAPEYFRIFTERIVSELAPDVRYWVTINEPMVYVYHSYILGVWPPQEKSVRLMKKVIDNMVLGHVLSYRSIHEIYKKMSLPGPMVSIAKNAQAFVPCRKTLLNRFGTFIRNKYYNLDFIERALRHKALDYIGINYYSRSLVDVEGLNPYDIFIASCKKPDHKTLPKNSLGWEIYPQGLYDILMMYKKYNLPQFILENGICTGDDSQRWGYIREHLIRMHQAMKDGATVIGYLYWSLIDNFEWDKGFAPRFGLIEVDYSSCKRIVRESAKKFSEVCRSGVLN